MCQKSNAARLQGGRRDCKEAEGAFEDLHVHITADSVEKVDAAVALVEPLLTPVDVRPVDVRLPPVRVLRMVAPNSSQFTLLSSTSFQI